MQRQACDLRRFDSFPQNKINKLMKLVYELNVVMPCTLDTISAADSNKCGLYRYTLESTVMVRIIGIHMKFYFIIHESL